MTETALAYIPRIRAYYQALGYGAPYEWAQVAQVPFSRLRQPLAQSRIAIVTTAAPLQPGKGDQGPGAAYNGAAKFFAPYALPVDPPPALGISHIAYDRTHTTAHDMRSFFPQAALQLLAQMGEIGSVAPRFYGLPTDRSVRKTYDYAAEILTFCQQDQVDAVVFVPNCPVCHQSCALAANTLESAGIVTVIMGAARDIIEHVGAPRLLFNNFPLGNAAGPPDDPTAQLDIALLAVELLDTASAPRTVLQSPFAWPGAADWQDSYSNAALLSADQIAAKRAEFDRVKAAAATLKAGSNVPQNDAGTRQTD